MSAEEKPGSTAPPPSGASEGEGDKSSPDLAQVDSAWNDEEDPDEEMTRVAKIPLDLVALSRRGTELEAKGQSAAAPEKHEAITARPPPPPGEESVVVDAPHQNLPRGAAAPAEVPSAEEDEREETPDGDEDLEADDLDAGWDIEEERAAAADVAAGLDLEARRRAAEARAVLRKEKGRAKKLAAREKRRARADSIRQKQKKPKRRSTPPPRDSTPVRSPSPAKEGPAPAAPSRERATIPPKDARAGAALTAARRDMSRMVFFVAIVVVVGSLAIGLTRR